MKTLVGIVAAILVIGGGYYLYQRSQAVTGGEQQEVVTGDTETNGTPSNGDTVGGGGATQPSDKGPEIKTFTVEGGGFYFKPSTMTVNKGDTVRIVFKNAGGVHDFVIDEFNAKTKQLQAGAEETIEFVADKAGTFEYYCSVGQHRQMGMKGVLTVTE